MVAGTQAGRSASYPAMTATTPPAMTVRAMKTMMLLRKKFATAMSLSRQIQPDLLRHFVYRSRMTKVSTPEMEQAVVNPAMIRISMGSFPRWGRGVGKDARGRTIQPAQTPRAVLRRGLFVYDLHLQCRRWPLYPRFRGDFPCQILVVPCVAISQISAVRKGDRRSSSGSMIGAMLSAAAQPKARCLELCDELRNSSQRHCQLSDL